MQLFSLQRLSKRVSKIIKLIGIVLFPLSVSSCVTIPEQKPAPISLQPPTPVVEMPVPVIRHNVIHQVAPGETLWRISKMYDVDIEKIMAANGIRYAEEIKMGQRLLIPNAAPIKPIIPLYPSRKWKYIVIHHSATDEGNALYFNKAHLKRGFWRGVGYHFVIDNGTMGKMDGQIEVTPRWIKQQDGAHCRASRMNYEGIGVCLVGNFSIERVSEKQMDSLVYLVDLLRRYYNIPIRNILGHGEVPDAATECPGRRFPWDEFYLRLHNTIGKDMRP